MSNHEPIAYWDGKHFASKEKSSLANIPLYTAPHYRELSKEDILKLAFEFDIWLGEDDIKFIQFVLKKAVEK